MNRHYLKIFLRSIVRMEKITYCHSLYIIIDKEKKLIMDLSDLLSIFVRIFAVVVIIQSFIQNDKPFAVTLLWSLWVLDSLFGKNLNDKHK